MRLFLLLIAVTALPTTAFAQKTLHAGDTMRAIYIGSWVQDSIAGDEPFAGKTLVLDFWSTWCGPCVKAIPHLNRLAMEFASETVIFAAVSNERAVTVQRFLEKTEMKATVFVDTESSLTHKIFSVRAIPRTFIFGPDRVVCWTGHPDKLTKEMLIRYIGPPRDRSEALCEAMGIERVCLAAEVHTILSAVVVPGVERPERRIGCMKLTTRDPDRDLG